MFNPIHIWFGHAFLSLIRSTYNSRLNWKNFTYHPNITKSYFNFSYCLLWLLAPCTPLGGTAVHNRRYWIIKCYVLIKLYFSRFSSNQRIMPRSGSDQHLPRVEYSDYTSISPAGRHTLLRSSLKSGKRTAVQITFIHLCHQQAHSSMLLLRVTIKGDSGSLKTSR